ncbi:uracil-DNA glycosylase [Lihuaxuella thermophila]|uniref:Type-4 uracil-DNA glycosylase n=1 Tax=Lihuaxuella thermophila TaxID=1173111 RepID=A0A1H8C7X5_9BACL|nr:uracil-DNA glycosylase [Lihuaxuella thermophila]SEM91301.1 DNA polymerase [Lihuaxuella thermophila]
MTTHIARLEAIADLEALKAACLRVFSPAEGEQVVFGEGPERARLMMIGEAPGEQEAESGRPFVGNAGRLLDKYLAEAGMDRGEVYITNVLKVRPPGNRTPRKSEIKEALPFLLRQIELVHPVILVCLGSISVQAVIDPKAKITEIRGKWVEKDGLQIMPTFHPSAVFHDESKREGLKRDLKEAGKRLKSLE